MCGKNTPPTTSRSFVKLTSYKRALVMSAHTYIHVQPYNCPGHSLGRHKVYLRTQPRRASLAVKEEEGRPGFVREHDAGSFLSFKRLCKGRTGVEHACWGPSEATKVLQARREHTTKRITTNRGTEGAVCACLLELENERKGRAEGPLQISASSPPCTTPESTKVLAEFGTQLKPRRARRPTNVRSGVAPNWHQPLRYARMNGEMNGGGVCMHFHSSAEQALLVLVRMHFLRNTADKTVRAHLKRSGHARECAPTCQIGQLATQLLSPTPRPANSDAPASRCSF